MLSKKNCYLKISESLQVIITLYSIQKLLLLQVHINHYNALIILCTSSEHNLLTTCAYQSSTHPNYSVYTFLNTTSKLNCVHITHLLFLNTLCTCYSSQHLNHSVYIWFIITLCTYYTSKHPNYSMYILLITTPKLLTILIPALLQEEESHSRVTGHMPVSPCWLRPSLPYWLQ